MEKRARGVSRWPTVGGATAPWAQEYLIVAQIMGEHIERSRSIWRERRKVGAEAIGRNQEEALARGVQREERVEGLERGEGGGVRDREGREEVEREEVEARRGEKEESMEEGSEDGLSPFQTSKIDFAQIYSHAPGTSSPRPSLWIAC